MTGRYPPVRRSRAARVARFAPSLPLVKRIAVAKDAAYQTDELEGGGAVVGMHRVGVGA